MSQHRHEEGGSSKRLRREGKPAVHNAFRNDGSFLEMFKKMQNQNGGKSAVTQASTTMTAAAVPFEPTSSESEFEGKFEEKLTPERTLPVGRRKALKALPVGKVKKLKSDDQEDPEKSKDAWSKYLAEVKKYKETHCEDETKCRSLVK